MRKLGGIALILIGLALIGLALLRLLDVLTLFLSEETSAYGTGFVVGTVVMLLLFSVLGIKAFKKGKALITSPITE